MIEECIQLKDEIEDQIRHGYLKKYVHKKECWHEVATSKKTTEELEIDNQSIEELVGMLSWWARPWDRYRERFYEKVF